jgi:hypothetical protein
VKLLVLIRCTVHLLLFCAMINKCTIISQFITLLNVSTLSCHPQTAYNQYLAKLLQMQLLVIQFTIKMFHTGFMQVLILKKGKAVPLQAWSCPEGSKKLRFSDFMTTAQDGGTFVSLTHRPPLPPVNTPATQFRKRLSRPQGHSATEKIMSLKNSNDTIGNRTRDLPVCTVVP